MTKVNENGQLEWTFEELDLYVEYNKVFTESMDLLSVSNRINSNALELAKNNDRFTFTDEYKAMVAESRRLYLRSRKLDEVAALIYTLFVIGENHG